MVKKFYFLLFAMLLSLTTFAQRFEYQLGLKGALGIDWGVYDNDDVSSKEIGLCYKYGLTGVYYFGESYGITSGFNIIGSNFSFKVSDIESKYKTTYCQIPVLLKMRTDNFAEKFRLMGEIGYGFDILVNGEYKLIDEKQASPYRDVCSSFIVHLGLEMEVLNRSVLQFIVGYDTVFSSMMTMKNDNIKMSNLCFELGFLF